MSEEEAIFRLGKQFSELRNYGDELPSERVQVGGSMVLPEELADEYDKHHPPGPRKWRQATPRVFRYRFDKEFLRDYRGEYLGLEITCEDQEYPFLKSASLFQPMAGFSLEDHISTSCDNRYDWLEFSRMTIVIDKLKLTAAVVVGQMGDHLNGFRQETTIWGDVVTEMEFEDFPQTRRVTYPFTLFTDFWQTWEKYQELRDPQVQEMRKERTSSLIDLD